MAGLSELRRFWDANPCLLAIPSGRSLEKRAGKIWTCVCYVTSVLLPCRRFLQTFGWKIIYVCLRTDLRYWNGELMRPDYTHHLKFSFTTSLNKKMRSVSKVNQIKLISKHVHYFMVIAFVLHRKRLFLIWIYLPMRTYQNIECNLVLSSWTTFTNET